MSRGKLLWILVLSFVVPGAGVVQAQSGPAAQSEVWVQEAAGIALTLRSDGHYAFEGPNVASRGRYQVQGATMVFEDASNGVVTVYTMEPVGQGVVALVDPQGNRMVFTLRSAPQPSVSPPPGSGGKENAGSGQTMVLVQPGGGITLTLRGDDTYRFEGPGFVSEGRFEMAGNRMTFHDAAKGTTTTYTVQPGGDGTVHLVDAQGNHLALRTTSGPAQAPAAAAPAQGGAPPPGSPGFMLWFLSSLPSMDADQVYQAYFFGLTESERLVVSISEGLNSFIFQMMCAGSHAAELRYNGATGMGEGCAQIVAQAQQTIAMGVNPGEYAEQQRQELIINEKCKLGLIDGASCGTYRGVRRQMARDSARTGQTIADNFAPPPCTRYYTPDGQFVGCW